MSLLHVEDLTVRYGPATGVRGVSLDVEPGCVTGVLGANGAGKTTTLLGIMNRVDRASGRVVFDGRDVTTMRTRELVAEGMALCPENRRLFPNMTIEDNLLLGAHGVARRVQRRRLEATYERFEWVGGRRRELAGRLSGGQQQIVAIARALMSQPKLVLLDEPSSGLAPVAIEEVRAHLEFVAADGTAVLLVEQNVELVQSLCERAVVLAHGAVRESGDVSELLQGATVADAYLGGLELLEGDEHGEGDDRPIDRPLRETRSMITTRDWTFPGRRDLVATRSWTDPDIPPRYIVLLVHGYGEHIGRYDHVAAALVAHGAVVFGPDHLGHGRSGGERVLIDDFDDVIADLATVCARAVACFPGCRWC